MDEFIKQLERIGTEPADVSKKHFYISLVKSLTRIVGCGAALVAGAWIWMALGLIIIWIS